MLNKKTPPYPYILHSTILLSVQQAVMMLLRLFSPRFVCIKIPPLSSSHLSLCFSLPLPALSCILFLLWKSCRETFESAQPRLAWLQWGKAAQPQETPGARVDMTWAARWKGLLSHCNVGRTSHHVSWRLLLLVTWRTADVANIDQPPARSWGRGNCLDDWQVSFRNAQKTFYTRFSLFLIVLFD